MRKLNIHIPLKIYNVDWRNQDLLVAVKNASKNKEMLTGQVQKSEWCMAYSYWTRASRLFLKYLKQVYRHNEFARAMAKHLK